MTEEVDRIDSRVASLIQEGNAIHAELAVMAEALKGEPDMKVGGYKTVCM